MPPPAVTGASVLATRCPPLREVDENLTRTSQIKLGNSREKEAI
jgi:hypothetical protein